MFGHWLSFLATNLVPQADPTPPIDPCGPRRRVWALPSLISAVNYPVPPWAGGGHLGAGGGHPVACGGHALACVGRGVVSVGHSVDWWWLPTWPVVATEWLVVATQRVVWPMCWLRLAIDCFALATRWLIVAIQFAPVGYPLACVGHVLACGGHLVGWCWLPGGMCFAAGGFW